MKLNCKRSWSPTLGKPNEIMQKKKSHLRMSHSKHCKCYSYACTQTPFQGTGGHLLAFSKALIKGMAEDTEGMGKEWEKKQQQLRFGKGTVPLS